MLEHTPATGSEGTGSSIYDSGGSNLDILESVGNSLLEEKTAAVGETSAGVDDTTSGASEGSSAGTAAGSSEPVVRPEWFETAPAEFKALIDHKNIGADAKKWLEEAYDELHGFRNSPVGTREAIAEVAELFPGGVEDMRVAAEGAQAFTREMEQFRSGDPAQQQELLSSLLQDEVGPEAFISMTSNALDLLKETLPRDYTQIAAGVTRAHLDEMSNNKFSTFFDSIRSVAAEYQAKVDAGDQEGAARLASRLGGYALQMGDWWGDYKGKLGYGEKGAEGAGLPRPSIVASKGIDTNDKEVVYAQRDAAHWSSNYIMKHDQMVRPLIEQAVTRDLAARKLDLPQSWKKDVQDFIDSSIKKALGADKQYVALENRVYRRGAPTDPRRWDNSDKVAQVLLNAVKQKAASLIPTLTKQALDRVAELRGGAAKPANADPASKQRGAGGPASGSGSGDKGWEEGLKKGEISTLDAIQRIAGVN